MKIVYSLPAVILCGGVVHHFSVIQRLVARGHRVSIHAPFVADLDLLPALPASVALHRHRRVRVNLYSLPGPARPLVMARTAWALTLGLRGMARDLPADADVMITGFYPNTLAADRMRRRTGSKCRIVQAAHEDPAVFVRASYRQLTPWFIDVPQRADALLTVGEALRDRLEQRYAKPTTNVRNGVDEALLRAPRSAQPPASVAGRPYLLYIGSLTRLKGIDLLLEAFVTLRQRHPDLQLVLAGKGSWEEYYLPLARMMGIHAHVHCLNGVDREQVRGLLDGAAVFVFPSRLESFGLPPLEAMARACPVVCAAAEGCLDYARDGENCLLVPVDDAASLAWAIDRLLGDPDLARRLAGQGKQTAATYTWDDVADRTERALQDCLAQR